jgi:hypothetical protein
MDGTTFRQPLPEALTTNLATGYSYVDGELEAAPLTYAVMAPADGVTLTPIDDGIDPRGGSGLFRGI